MNMYGHISYIIMHVYEYLYELYVCLYIFIHIYVWKIFYRARHFKFLFHYYSVDH